MASTRAARKGPSHWARTVEPTWASSTLARASRDSTRSTHCSIDWRPGAAWAGEGSVAVVRAISAAERRDIGEALDRNAHLAGLVARFSEMPEPGKTTI